MHDIFKTKDLSDQLRDNHIVYQPKFKGITYGKHTFAYLWKPYLECLAKSSKGKY